MDDSTAPAGSSSTAAKGPIQAEAADCFLQIAVFEPGRLLLQQDPAAMLALRALADPSNDCALTAKARLSAAGALVAIEGLARKELAVKEELEPEGHVFVSYQWARPPAPRPSLLLALAALNITLANDRFCLCYCGPRQNVQTTIERIVRSLQKRGFAVWFDMDCMQGSTMDAMSEAVDGAEVMLFAVSQSCEPSCSLTLLFSWSCLAD